MQLSYELDIKLYSGLGNLSNILQIVMLFLFFCLIPQLMLTLHRMLQPLPLNCLQLEISLPVQIKLFRDRMIFIWGHPLKY